VNGRTVEWEYINRVLMGSQSERAADSVGEER
jgi:hypothetical protein